MNSLQVFLKHALHFNVEIRYVVKLLPVMLALGIYPCSSPSLTVSESAPHKRPMENSCRWVTCMDSVTDVREREGAPDCALAPSWPLQPFGE